MKNLKINLNKLISLNFILFSFICCISNFSYGQDENDYTSKSYFTSKNAIPLKKGEGYYQNVDLLYNSVSFAIVDGLTISGGFLIIPEFVASFHSSVHYAQSINKNINVSGGFNIITTDNGIRYNPILKGTYGDRANNISAGISISPYNKRVDINFERVEIFDLNVIVEISGKLKMNKYVSIISENRMKIKKFSNPKTNEDIIDNSINTISGIRVHLKKHLIDLGSGVTIPINLPGRKPRFELPYVGYTFMFGKV